MSKTQLSNVICAEKYCNLNVKTGIYYFLGPYEPDAIPDPFDDSGPTDTSNKFSTALLIDFTSVFLLLLSVKDWWIFMNYKLL